MRLISIQVTKYKSIEDSGVVAVDPNVTVTPTGVSAATAVGTASVTAAQNVSIDATGVAATTALGTATARLRNFDHKLGISGIVP